MTFPVVLPDGNTYQVAGYLYWTGQLDGKVLHVAVHGAGYNHKYWDADDIGEHRYSYARHMASRGFAVLALDNLGAGASSKPDGDLVTIKEEAVALHQIIQGLGAAPVGASFRKIVLVGHSMGSAQVITAQSTYHDADGMVVTGWVSTRHTVPLPPDALDALFGAPYVFLPPQMRAQVFYGGDFDPEMPVYDNKNLIDRVPRGVFNQDSATTPRIEASISAGIRSPVLLIFSELDPLMPASFASSDAAAYSNAVSVETFVARHVGHNLNLHRFNLEAWARIDNWIRDKVAG